MAEEDDDGVGPELAVFVGIQFAPSDAMTLWLFYRDLQK